MRSHPFFVCVISGLIPHSRRQKPPADRPAARGPTKYNPLQTELEYFQQHRQEYQKLYKGQLVLIKGTEFARAFTTEAEAYKAGLEKFGNTPFFIKQVLDKDETPVWMR